MYEPFVRISYDTMIHNIIRTVGFFILRIDVSSFVYKFYVRVRVRAYFFEMYYD